MVYASLLPELFVIGTSLPPGFRPAQGEATRAAYQPTVRLLTPEGVGDAALRKPDRAGWLHCVIRLVDSDLWLEFLPHVDFNGAYGAAGVFQQNFVINDA